MKPTPAAFATLKHEFSVECVQAVVGRVLENHPNRALT